MAEAFVRQLPRIPSCALPSDANCPICIQPYENLTTDTGSFEKPVALPCSNKHIFGSDCLTEWLTNGKNCPFCRRAMTLPNAADKQFLNMDRQTSTQILTIVNDQALDEYFYRIFWILHLHGDPAVESAWHQWQEDWIWAAEEWDESCHVQARAALSLSPLMKSKRSWNIRSSAAAIQTLRFREYRLFLRFQADAGGHPELKAQPGFQLTPAQEDTLLQELDRRQAFEQILERVPGTSKREQWNMIRDIGLVWDPDWDAWWTDFPGRWSRYAY